MRYKINRHTGLLDRVDDPALDTGDNGIIDKAESLDDGAGNIVTAATVKGITDKITFDGTLFNTLLGINAGIGITNGNDNVFSGEDAGKSITSGKQNIFIGKTAGSDVITALANIFIGTGAGWNSKSNGESSVYIGFTAGAFAAGHKNVMIGNNAGKNSTKDFNTVLGFNAAQKCNDRNVMIGCAAGENNTGDKNIFLGCQTGQNNTGNSNVFIGYQVGLSAISGNNKLAIDNSNTATPLIYGEFDTNYVKINGRLEITGKITASLSTYANNATAIVGGLTAGDFYRTGADPDLVCIVH